MNFNNIVVGGVVNVVVEISGDDVVVLLLMLVRCSGDCGEIKVLKKKTD